VVKISRRKKAMIKWMVQKSRKQRYSPKIGWTNMKFSRIALWLAALAAFLLLIGGPGTRFGLWDFRDGFLMMRWAAYMGLVSAGLALTLLIIPRMRMGQGVWLLSACVIGLGVAYVPWQLQQLARSVPPIHDITTDTLDPPEFIAILPLRAEAPNPPGYAGEEVARLQQEAYPDILSCRLDAGAEIAFEQALAAARKMGWEIVTANSATGRIEAIATTFWYGFKDDVVVRIGEDNGGSIIDVRSKSRVGRSDLGANASRIRVYLEELKAIGL
jgi:hypothetical protein